MAEQVKQASEDKTIEKAVWHYVGVTVLWVSLFLTGIAFERLGLTSGLLSNIFPGEIGSLRAQSTECESSLGKVKLERDRLSHEQAALQVEVKKLQGQIAVH